MLVVHPSCPQLYRALGHCSIYNRYGVRGFRFPVYQYGGAFIPSS